MDNSNFDKLLQNIINAITAMLVFLVPFFFLSFTTEFYIFNKQALILVATCILFLLWMIQATISRKISIAKNRLNLPIITIALVYITSLFFASTNKTEALMSPLGVGTTITLTILYFTITSAVNSKGGKIIYYALILSGVVLGISTLYQYLGFGEAFMPAEYLKNRAWTPTGALLTTSSYLFTILIFTTGKLIFTVKKKLRTELVLVGFSALIILIGFLTSLYQLFTSNKPLLLPQAAGWKIAAESIKANPLLGVGVENFITAFTRGRPADLNMTDVWNLRFGLSSNAYFHIFTTLGLLGILSLLFFTIVIVLTFFRKETVKKEILASIGLILILFALFPPNFLLFFILYVFASLLESKKDSITLPLPHHQLTSVWLVVPTVLILTVLYFGASAYRAEYAFKKSIDARIANNGTDTYNFQIKARNINPYLDKYRIAYANTNINIANALSQKSDLSDQDRTTITQLIQQSIREARNAVILNRKRVTNWESLALIYKQLMNFADGAQNWTIASYREAVNLDHTNPLLRIDYGGVFYALGDFDSAIRQFEVAVQLKPDLANAHYNLASALREKKEYNKALAELQAVESLVKPDSNDASKVKSEIEDLKKIIGEKETTQSAGEPETLTTPQPAQPQLTPPIEIPIEEETAPPEATSTLEPETEIPPPLPSPNL